jgi:hypothetical protein
MRFIGERQGAGSPIESLGYVAANLVDLLPSPLLLGLLLLLLTLPRGGRIAAFLPTLLQLLIPPALVVLGGKSLYNELRHLMMIQPPLCVLGGLGYARALAALPAVRGTGNTRGLRKPLLRPLLVLSAAATVLLATELLLLNPYQYTYRSDLARLAERGRGAALRRDYWGFSGRETLARCLGQEDCAGRLERLPLRVDPGSFNPDLIEASATLLRPAPPAGPDGSLLISTDPGTLAGRDTLAATRRLTLLPWPRQATLSAIAPDPEGRPAR